MFSRLLDQIKCEMISLPVHTQVSVAVHSANNTDHYGLYKDDEDVRLINNAELAFEIGSITKAFTGNVLAQLVAEEKLRLDDPIAPFLPFTLLNNPVITFRHLAQHTSGLPRLAADFEEQADYNPLNPYLNYREEQLRNYLSEEVQLESVPGEKFNYSNLGYGVLSYLISLIEKASFPDIVNKRIFRPLLMRHSTFDADEVTSTLVKGFNEEGEECKQWSGSLHSGAIGIISTTQDLIRFAITVMNTQNAASNLQTNEAFSAEPAFKMSLGLGERLFGAQQVPVLGINGGTCGYGASMMINRQTKCTIVILSNIAPTRYMEIIYPIAKERFIEFLTNNPEPL